MFTFLHNLGAMSLNAKQRLFVKHYIIERNATQAAIKAGYSEHTAGSQGHDLLKKPEIAAEVANGLRAHERHLELKAISKNFTKERWLEELMNIATSSIDDAIKIKQKTVSQGGDGEGYVVTTAEAVPTNQRSPLIGRAIKKISETKNGIGIEMHSKQAALDTLGRAYGWVKDRTEISGPDGGPQVIVSLPSNGREVAEFTTNSEKHNANASGETTSDDGESSEEGNS